MAGFSNCHNAVATSSLISLGGQLRGKPYQVFNSSTKVRIEFPDQPVVVIEVLSASTRRADLGEKRDAYLTLPSLKVLLFVEPEKPSVTLHRRKPGGGFAIAHHGGLDAGNPLPEIDASLALADLDDRVEFV